MAKVLGIHHVQIETWNIEESIRYYRDKLGFDMVDRETCSFGEYAMMKSGSARIELIQHCETREDDPGRPAGPIPHIGFEVDDVPAIHKELKARGVVFREEEVERYDEPNGGIEVVCTKGPSGEELNFYHFIHEI